MLRIDVRIGWGWRSCLARNSHVFNTPKKKTNTPIQYRNYCADKIIWVGERGTCGTNWNYLRSLWSLDGRLILCWSKDFSHCWYLKRRYCVHKMPSLACSLKPPDPVCLRTSCMVMSDTLTLVTGYAVSGFFCSYLDSPGYFWDGVLKLIISAFFQILSLSPFLCSPYSVMNLWRPSVTDRASLNILAQLSVQVVDFSARP